MNPVTSSGGLYGRVAALELEVDGCELERLEKPVSSGFNRVTTVVRLRGGGSVGLGEDVTYDAADHDDFPAELPLSGTRSFAAFSRQLGGLELFAARPARTASIDYRRWAFESAALDLALRQAGLSLGAALGLAYRPVRFIVSTRLDIRSWLALYPRLEFKLDPTPEWDDELVRQLAATGSVRVVDFKAFYEGTPVDNPPDPQLYARVVAAFPDAIVEDAELTPRTRPALKAALDRLSWDARIHSWRDVTKLPVAPRFLNIKPSRFGRVERLFECLEKAAAAGITMYGGGQFELGPGRGQIQALAGLFFPDSPNDVAPLGYNEPEPAPGLRASPLDPPARPAGFSWG